MMIGNEEGPDTRRYRLKTKLYDRQGAEVAPTSVRMLVGSEEALYTYDLVDGVYYDGAPDGPTRKVGVDASVVNEFTGLPVQPARESKEAGSSLRG